VRTTAGGSRTADGSADPAQAAAADAPAPQPALTLPGPAPAANAAPAVTAAPATPQHTASPAAQLANHIAPLRQEPDGIHRLTVHLHPEELGPVSVTAEIRGNQVHLHLAGATDAGREALRAALPDLHRELQSAGFTTASLDVRHEPPAQQQPGQQHQPGQQPAPHRHERAGHERAPQPQPPQVPEPTARTDNRLDLRV
jgi:flagellar hook-length control protein FliK